MATAVNTKNFSNTKKLSFQLNSCDSTILEQEEDENILEMPMDQKMQELYNILDDRKQIYKNMVKVKKYDIEEQKKQEQYQRHLYYDRTIVERPQFKRQVQSVSVFEADPKFVMFPISGVMGHRERFQSIQPERAKDPNTMVTDTNCRYFGNMPEGKLMEREIERIKKWEDSQNLQKMIQYEELIKKQTGSYKKQQLEKQEKNKPQVFLPPQYQPLTAEQNPDQNYPLNDISKNVLFHQTYKKVIEEEGYDPNSICERYTIRHNLAPQKQPKYLSVLQEVQKIKESANLQQLSEQNIQNSQVYTPKKSQNKIQQQQNKNHLLQSSQLKSKNLSQNVKKRSQSHQTKMYEKQWGTFYPQTSIKKFNQEKINDENQYINNSYNQTHTNSFSQKKQVSQFLNENSQRQFNTLLNQSQNKFRQTLRSQSLQKTQNNFNQTSRRQISENPKIQQQITQKTPLRPLKPQKSNFYPKINNNTHSNNNNQDKSNAAISIIKNPLNQYSITQQKQQQQQQKMLRTSFLTKDYYYKQKREIQQIQEEIEDLQEAQNNFSLQKQQTQQTNQEQQILKKQQTFNEISKFLSNGVGSNTLASTNFTLNNSKKSALSNKHQAFNDTQRNMELSSQKKKYFSFLYGQNNQSETNMAFNTSQKKADQFLTKESSLQLGNTIQDLSQVQLFLPNILQNQKQQENYDTVKDFLKLEGTWKYNQKFASYKDSENTKRTISEIAPENADQIPDPKKRMCQKYSDKGMEINIQNQSIKQYPF